MTQNYTMTDEHKAALKASRSSANKTVISVTNQWRIYAVDNRNWTLQKNSGTNDVGETIWISQFFYSTLTGLLRSLSSKLVNKELRFKGEVDFKAFIACINEAEVKVMDMLNGLAKDSKDEAA